MKTKLTIEEKKIKRREYHKLYKRKLIAKLGKENTRLNQVNYRKSDLGKAALLAYRFSIRGICVAALYGAKTRSKKHKREFAITLDYLISIYPKSHVCPVRFIKMKPAINKVGSAHAPTLDRINNSKGYIVGNVRFISFSANARKGAR